MNIPEDAQSSSDDFEESPKTPDAIRELVEQYRNRFPPGSRIEILERTGERVEKIVMRYETSGSFSLNKIHLKPVNGKGNTTLHIGVLKTAELLEKEADPIIAMTAEYEDRVRRVVQEFLTEKAKSAVVDVVGDGGYVLSEIMIIMRRKKKSLVPDAIRKMSDDDIAAEAEEILRNRRK